MASYNNWIDFINTRTLSLAFKDKLDLVFLSSDGWQTTVDLIPDACDKGLRVAVYFNDEYESMREAEIYVTLKRLASDADQLGEDLLNAEQTIVGYNYDISRNGKDYVVLSCLPASIATGTDGVTPAPVPDENNTHLFLMKKFNCKLIRKES